MATAEVAAPAPNVTNRLEDGLGAAALLVMALLPVLELVLRTLLNTGIPGSFGYVQHLTLWVAFLGAMIASREKRHIVLSGGLRSLPPRVQGNRRYARCHDRERGRGRAHLGIA